MIEYYKPWSIITENGTDNCEHCPHSRYCPAEPDVGLGEGWKCNANSIIDCEHMQQYAIDTDKLENIVMSDVNMADYPDFSDAFIKSADFNGFELSEDAIKWLNEQKPEFVHEQAHESRL